MVILSRQCKQLLSYNAAKVKKLAILCLYDIVGFFFMGLITYVHIHMHMYNIIVCILYMYNSSCFLPIFICYPFHILQLVFSACLGRFYVTIVTRCYQASIYVHHQLLPDIRSHSFDNLAKNLYSKVTKETNQNTSYGKVANELFIIITDLLWA